jgi:plasmid replication initiation protein
MEDKRFNQVSLPLGLAKKPEFKEYVKQHWNVTFARQKKVSVCAKRIMVMVLAQIRDNDMAFKPYYQMHVADVISPESYNDRRSAFKEVRKAFDELMDQRWYFEDVKNERFVPRHILDTTKIQEVDGFECAYDHGLITVVINPALKPYFIELAHYTTYEIKHYMTFSSWYSMRMFELLAAYKDTGIWVVGIEEFRELMDCKDKYLDNTKLLLEKILAEPLKELETTKYAFTFKPLENEFKRGKGRKPIAALEFRLKHVDPASIPKEWYQFSDEHRNVLVELQKFKVTEKNILRYAKAIGLNGAKKLLKEWKEKESSNTRIDNKEKYCNAVWVRVGKQYLKEGA